MYGDLFGDLPEAKKSSANVESTAAETLPVIDQAAASTEATLSTKPSEKQPLQSSIVKSVGASGTAVAFVPTAALKPRKRQRPSSKPSVSTAAVSKSTTTLHSEQVSENAEKELVSEFKVDTVHDPAEIVIGDETEASAPAPEQSTASLAPSNTIQPPQLGQHHSRLSDSDRQRLRQQAMDDPYDPMVPNDLLEYWERKAVAAERERLEREKLEQLQQQDALRRQLDMERRALEQEGNADKLAEHVRQRGRGRGVSNLPAWLVAKHNNG